MSFFGKRNNKNSNLSPELDSGLQFLQSLKKKKSAICDVDHQIANGRHKHVIFFGKQTNKVELQS